MPLGTEVGLSPGDSVRWGSCSLPKRGHSSAHFLAHVYCGQTTRYITIPLAMEVGLGPGDLVLDGVLAPHGKGHSSRHFSVRVYCGQTARRIGIPLGTELGLGPGDIMLDGDPALHTEGKVTATTPHISAHFALARAPISPTVELLYSKLFPRS